jgi:5-methylcytosine-specific restriction endonuclease McrA
MNASESVEDPRVRALRQETAARRKAYRERALRLLPHVCASCGRSFEGRRLRELTVHHKDHNHAHNPPDGSNWELLCLYCHDYEHEKELTARQRGGAPAPAREALGGGFPVFEGLDRLVHPEDGERTP